MKSTIYLLAAFAATYTAAHLRGLAKSAVNAAGELQKDQYLASISEATYAVAIVFFFLALCAMNEPTRQGRPPA